MWEKIYSENKKLDEIFMSKYGNDINYYEKNCIELIVELSEFANETKCFKYWSIKKMEKDKALEEYADVITMSLSFFTILNTKLEIIEHSNTNNILDLLNTIYKNCSMLYDNKEEYLVKQIFSDIVYLGELIGFKESEIENMCYKKMKIVNKRLSSNY